MKFDTDNVMHLIVIAFMGVILWMMQSMVSIAESERTAELGIMDRLSALEVIVKQECK